MKRESIETIFGLIFILGILAIAIFAYYYTGWIGVGIVVALIVYIILEGAPGDILRYLLNYKERRRHKPIANGLCGKCRYDLRATPDQCPECGEKSA